MTYLDSFLDLAEARDWSMIGSLSCLSNIFGDIFLFFLLEPARGMDTVDTGCQRPRGPVLTVNECPDKLRSPAPAMFVLYPRQTRQTMIWKCIHATYRANTTLKMPQQLETICVNTMWKMPLKTPFELFDMGSAVSGFTCR